MAEQQRSYDIWLVDLNRVYRDVPFTVVGDWIQQGRLLEKDKVRPAGTQEWLPLGKVPLFTPYLPKPEPPRAEDKAEALERVELDFEWKKPAVEEEEDVDMIPLIDISLVLLIFFMMTAGHLLSVSAIETPQTRASKAIQPGPQNLTVGLRLVGGKPTYYLGDQVSSSISEKELLAEVSKQVKSNPSLNVIVKAHQAVPYDTVRQLTLKLQEAGAKKIRAGVRDELD